jgi:hypothetical protein
MTRHSSMPHDAKGGGHAVCDDRGVAEIYLPNGEVAQAQPDFQMGGDIQPGKLMLVCMI